jgi:hypothetical protein
LFTINKKNNLIKLLENLQISKNFYVYNEITCFYYFLIKKQEKKIITYKKKNIIKIIFYLFLL